MKYINCSRQNIRVKWMEREAGKVDGLDTHVMKNNTSELYDKKKKKEFQKGYQPWINRLTDGRGNLLVDSHSILSKWKDHLSSLSLHRAFCSLFK